MGNPLKNEAGPHTGKSIKRIDCENKSSVRVEDQCDMEVNNVNCLAQVMKVAADSSSDEL
jgi:hypothetical protein